ncbi:hypothetical protein GN958_ATG08664 [Phytophthora infestans]|uniref:BZIP domain-containing protein n=1 Tax=Phytophthora infestans TaxID=4787 RepID=A0A8S9U347_PHYIN|nr:hypothetical protein GN958_ATG15296 [Phytophthora infestans]KAF4142166.1 hypothetical protein GN958_ATG08664 [Phytophthora infestans]
MPSNGHFNGYKQSQAGIQTTGNQHISSNFCPRSTSTYSTQTTPSFKSLDIVQEPNGKLPTRSSPTMFSGTFTHLTIDKGQNHISPSEGRGKEAVDDHRRKRIRLTQARYRQKLHDKPKQLKIVIQQLKEQTQHLQYEHNHLLSGASSQPSVWLAAVEYFRIFRRCCNAPRGTNIVDMDTLKTLIASDVAFCGGIGLDALLQHWWVLTQYFPDVDIKLNNLQQITDDSVLATTTTTFTISSASMANAFPHLINLAVGDRVASN